MRHRWIAAAFVAATLSVDVPARADDTSLPRIDHVVVVILENHAFNQIIDPDRAPFIHGLAAGGALFVNSYAVAHPSQPNYFALFSGSTHGVGDDDDHSFDAPTLAAALAGAHKSFIGYVETRSPRKHNPWESFVDARAAERNLDEFPADFARLPTVSFVIPDLDHDMHDGSVADGDRWVQAHLGAYAEWARTHDSLLILTFDEDDYSDDNRIPTIISGAHVRPGRYTERISHYSVLRTLLALHALPPFAEAATTPPIRTIWDRAE